MFRNVLRHAFRHAFKQLLAGLDGHSLPVPGMCLDKCFDMCSDMGLDIGFRCGELVGGAGDHPVFFLDHPVFFLAIILVFVSGVVPASEAACADETAAAEPKGFDAEAEKEAAFEAEKEAAF